MNTVDFQAFSDRGRRAQEAVDRLTAARAATMIVDYALIMRGGRIIGHRPYAGGAPILASIGYDAKRHVALHPARRPGFKPPKRGPVSDDRVFAEEEFPCLAVRMVVDGRELVATACDDRGSGALDVWPDIPEPWGKWRARP
jgi:hypothetical protein